MPDFESAINDTPITEYDILCDMISTLNNSKYSESFVIKGAFALGLELR